jgi:hypothetical protein
MVFLDLFVELILAIVQLLAHRASGEPPDSGVSSDLMLVRNELDGVQRLLRGGQLVVVDSILMILGDRTRQAGREDSRVTLINRGGFINLPGYLWGYTWILGGFWYHFAPKVKALPFLINFRFVGFDKPGMEIIIPRVPS